MKWWQIQNIGFDNRLRSPDGDDGPANGGDQQPSEIDQLKAERDKIAQKNKQILDEQKTLKDQLKKFEGIDPEQVRKVMKSLEENEELKLITEGKHDEVIKRRTEKVESVFKSQIEALQAENNASKQQLEAANSKIQKLLIDNNAVGAFVKAGGLETAVDDVVLRAQREFKVEDGVPIKRDENGEIVRGKNGPITLEEWAVGLREKAPHLFPSSDSPNTNGGRKSKQVQTLEDKLMEARRAGNTREVHRLKVLIEEEKKKG